MTMGHRRTICGTCIKIQRCDAVNIGRFLILVSIQAFKTNISVISLYARTVELKLLSVTSSSRWRLIICFLHDL